MENLEIRGVVREDIPALLELLREFAEYEKLVQYLEVDAERLERAFFSDGATVEGLIAREGGRPSVTRSFFPISLVSADSGVSISRTSTFAQRTAAVALVRRSYASLHASRPRAASSV